MDDFGAKFLNSVRVLTFFCLVQSFLIQNLIFLERCCGCSAAGEAAGSAGQCTRRCSAWASFENLIQKQNFGKRKVQIFIQKTFCLERILSKNDQK